MPPCLGLYRVYCITILYNLSPFQVPDIHVQQPRGRFEILATFFFSPPVSFTNCIGTMCIGNKLYREQIVLGTFCVGNKLYRVLESIKRRTYYLGKVTLEHAWLSLSRYNLCRYSLFLIQFVHESYVKPISSSSHKTSDTL
jgi:hypothetical protein